MRMRLKKWARPELEACSFYVSEPEKCRGEWRNRFLHPERPLYLELGCGKGVATCEMALKEPEINLVAVDINSSVLGVAKRNAEAKFAGERTVDNLLLTNFEVERITSYFAPEDRVERIIISFPNPWDQRHRQEKHRLTYPKQLLLYRQFLTERGEIWFKTDNEPLFRDSLEYFPQAGFELQKVTWDLHAQADRVNYLSEHEMMFTAQGIPTKALIAVKQESVPDLAGTAGSEE